MRTATVRTWCRLHTWSSLACTLFLLMLCLTGLPLIFHDEIDAALDDRRPLPAAPANARMLPLDAYVRTATAMYPGERPLFMSFDDDRPVANVTTAKVAQPGRGNLHITAIDRRTARPVGALDEEGGIMATILRLHVDMFAGLPGKLFLGFMGLLFCASIVSGIVAYAPFMRKLAFGEIRSRRSRRVRWLDLHNLLGIATAMWLGVVGLTGVVNTLSETLTAIWRTDQLAALTEPYQGQPPLPIAAWGSVDRAMRTARSAAPGTDPQFIAFPGTRFSSEHHYAVWLKGATPATRQLLTPALVDARNGTLTALRAMPWYMLALRLSQPLHFGDYGALPMKVLWALLDLVAIVVLGSGVYLWLSRRRAAA